MACANFSGTGVTAIAYVSWTHDWQLNDKLVQTLRRDPDADLAAIKRTYLAHIWQRAQAYRDLSRQLQGTNRAGAAAAPIT